MYSLEMNRKRNKNLSYESQSQKHDTTVVYEHTEAEHVLVKCISSYLSILGRKNEIIKGIPGVADIDSCRENKWEWVIPVS
jgi:hypothetical protein